MPIMQDLKTYQDNGDVWKSLFVYLGVNVRNYVKLVFDNLYVKQGFE